MYSRAGMNVPAPVKSIAIDVGIYQLQDSFVVNIPD